MFSKGDSYRDVVMCSVSITMTSGVVMNGIIQRPRAKKLVEYLNDGTMFLEVELYDGATVQVSKASIAHCQIRDVPKAEQLALAVRRADVYHPIGTLGLDTLQSKDAIRQAYRNKIRLYHADHYAGVELPEEVSAYLQEMAQRLNMAYADAMSLLDGHRRPGGADAAHAEAH